MIIFRERENNSIKSFVLLKWYFLDFVEKKNIIEMFKAANKHENNFSTLFSYVVMIGMWMHIRAWWVTLYNGYLWQTAIYTALQRITPAMRCGLP